MRFFNHLAVAFAVETVSSVNRILPISPLDLEILRRGLAAIRDFLVLDDLTLIQTG
jgi:hypothetical protein